MNYSKNDVIERFEALFQDKVVLPDSLVDVWFDMALAEFAVEVDTLDYSKSSGRFGCTVDSYVVSILAELMKK